MLGVPCSQPTVCSAAILPHECSLNDARTTTQLVGLPKVAVNQSLAWWLAGSHELNLTIPNNVG
jgi:hypothetical protein